MTQEVTIKPSFIVTTVIEVTEFISACVILTLEHTQHWMGWIELWDNGRLDNLADDSYDEDYDDE